MSEGRRAGQLVGRASAWPAVRPVHRIHYASPALTLGRLNHLLSSDPDPFLLGM